MIKAYLERMNCSNTAGYDWCVWQPLPVYWLLMWSFSVMTQFNRLFMPSNLLSASVMAAPGAIVVAKILMPQTEKLTATLRFQKKNQFLTFWCYGIRKQTDGLKLAVNIGAMLFGVLLHLLLWVTIFYKSWDILLHSCIGLSLPYSQPALLLQAWKYSGIRTSSELLWSFSCRSFSIATSGTQCWWLHIWKFYQSMDCYSYQLWQVVYGVYSWIYFCTFNVADWRCQRRHYHSDSCLVLNWLLVNLSDCIKFGWV